MRHELRVNRAELADGLLTLRKSVKRKTTMDAVFTFEKGNLVLFLDGVQIEAEAEGVFPGMVRIPGLKALNLSDLLPSEEPLRIAHDEERLYLGSFSMPCTWHNLEPNTIQLPMDAPFTVLLGLPLKYTDQEILQSGLSKPLEVAQRRRKLLTTKAVNLLAERVYHGAKLRSSSRSRSNASIKNEGSYHEHTNIRTTRKG